MLKVIEKLDKVKNVFKKKYGRLFIWINFLLLVILCLLMYTVNFLPQYIQNEILPDIAAKLPFDISDAKIRRVGLTGADIGNVYFWNKGGGTVEVSSVRVDYSPWDLLFRDTVHIENLTLSGVTLKCVVKDGKINFPQVGNVSFAAFKSEYKHKLDWIKIENGIFILENGRKSFRLPFSLAITSQSDNFQECVIYGKLFPRSNPLEFTSKINFPNKNLSITGQAALALERFADLLPDGVLLRGSADMDFKALCGFEPFKLKNLKLDCDFDDLSLKYNDMTLKNTSKKAVITAFGRNDKFHVNMTGFVVDAGLPFEFTSIDSSVDAQENRLKIETMANCRIAGALGGAVLSSPVNLAIEIGSHYNYDGSWRSHSAARNLLTTGFNAAVGKRKLSSGLISWNMDAYGNLDKLNLNCAVKAKDIKLSAADFNYVVPEMQLSALYGNGAFSGKLSCYRGSVVSDKHKLKISGAELRLPYAGKDKTKGTLRIDKLVWKGQNIGNFDSKVRLAGDKAIIRGALGGYLLPRMNVEVSAHCDWPDFRSFQLGALMPEFKQVTPFLPGKIFPGLKGVEITGKCSGRAEVSCQNGQMHSSATISVGEALLKKQDADLAIDGINTQIEITDLNKFTSKPSQKIMFKSLNAGVLKLNNGKLNFQIESPDTLLIEKFAADWCGGKLYSNALRMNSERCSYRLQLFCDGIGLANLLGQLGIADGSGSGTLSGRLPLQYNGKGLILKSGFLHSDSEKGNKLILVKTGNLLNGIDKETAEYTQLDLAGEALKDFEYNRAKISLVTDKDQLKVKMHIDGTPIKPLPFVYDQAEKSYIRTDKASEKLPELSLNIDNTIPLKTTIFGSR